MKLYLPQNYFAWSSNHWTDCGQKLQRGKRAEQKLALWVFNRKYGRERKWLTKAQFSLRSQRFISSIFCPGAAVRWPANGNWIELLNWKKRTICAHQMKILWTKMLLECILSISLNFPCLKTVRSGNFHGMLTLKGGATLWLIFRRYMSFVYAYLVYIRDF